MASKEVVAVGRVKLNVYAGLRACVGGQGSLEVEVRPGETVGQLLDRLAIPRNQTRILFVNHRHADWDQPLADGEQVGVFPAIGGG